MKKNLLLLLGLAASAAMLFSGCGKKDSSSDLEVNETLLPVETQDAELFPTEEDEASAEQSQADDMPHREGMARSRLTGEWVDEDVANTRPIAVMIPNSKTASYYGLSKLCQRFRIADGIPACRANKPQGGNRSVRRG